MTTFTEHSRAEPAFAVFARPSAGHAVTAEVYTGTPLHEASLDDVAELHRTTTDPVVFVLPYSTVGERGFDHRPDPAPLLAFQATTRRELDLEGLLAELPHGDVGCTIDGFDDSDTDYENAVERVIREEIGRGAGSNFVLCRTMTGSVGADPEGTGLRLLGRLLRQESGAYWTYLVRVGDRVVVGATPEMHLRIRSGTATLNPISGTHRYPRGVPEAAELAAFVADTKESEELLMVVDEELKMMNRIATGNIVVHGPGLRLMSRLAHTEFHIHGQVTDDVFTVLRQTLLAPTVTGSPVQNACRVIARHERTGRGYYAGVVGVASHDDSGSHLDSAIVIRSAEISGDGRMHLRAGATIVRSSDPSSEAVETRTKLASLHRALSSEPLPVRRTPTPDLANVHTALRARRGRLSPFWTGARPVNCEHRPAAGLHGILLDGEDDFSLMLQAHLEALGATVDVVAWHQADQDPRVLLTGDLVVLGPGPGDPRDPADPRIRAFHKAADLALAVGHPTMGVCLGHQVLSLAIGLTLKRLEAPNQGTPRSVHLDGTEHQLGFYNTFATTDPGTFTWRGTAVEVILDDGSGTVAALRSPHFSSAQFHPESILSRDGLAALEWLLAPFHPTPRLGPDSPRTRYARA